MANLKKNHSKYQPKQRKLPKEKNLFNKTKFL